MTVPVDFFSPQVQNLLIAAFVAFGGAMFWLGVLTNKLYGLNKDLKSLQKEFNKLSIEFGADILARRMVEERRRQGEPQGP